MTSYTAPLKDFTFLINEFLGLERYSDVPGFDQAQELAQPLLDEAARFTQEVLHPLNQVGDTQGLKYSTEDHSVTTPEGFKEAYQQYAEGGWATITWPEEFGGQNLPEFLNMPMLEMVCRDVPYRTAGRYRPRVSAYQSNAKRRWFLRH